MPTLEDNKNTWSAYAWSERGDEWSEAWGSTEALWLTALYPRIVRYLPSARVVEIASGFGRCTQYLRGYCERLDAFDVTERCVDACRSRFAHDPRVHVHQSDGRQLPGVEDRSIGFAFSYDSLVHVDEEILRSYLAELARVLDAEGVAFLHHSNFATLVDPATQQPLVENVHWRDQSVSAAKVDSWCEMVGLSCVSQELVGWGGSHLTDAFTLLTRKGSKHDAPNRVVENHELMRAARQAALINDLYGLVGSD